MLPASPLYTTHTDLVDSYHQMQSKSLMSYRKSLSLEKIFFPVCILTCCLRAGFCMESYLNMGFVWICRTPLRGSAPRRVDLKH